MIIDILATKALDQILDVVWHRYGYRMRRRALIQNAQFFIGQLPISHELPDINFVLPRFYPEHYCNEKTTNSKLLIKQLTIPEKSCNQKYHYREGSWYEVVPVYSEFLSHEDVLAAKEVALAVPERLNSQQLLSPDEYARKYKQISGPTIFIGSPRSNPPLLNVLDVLDIELRIDLDLIQNKNSQRFIRIKNHIEPLENGCQGIAIIGRYVEKSGSANVKIFIVGDSAANTTWAAQYLAKNWQDLQYKFPNGGNCIQIFKGTRPPQGQQLSRDYLGLVYETGL